MAVQSICGIIGAAPDPEACPADDAPPDRASDIVLRYSFVG